MRNFHPLPRTDFNRRFLPVPASFFLNAEIVVLENYYKPSHREKLKELKKAYHRNFSLALMAHRMTSDIQDSLDEGLIQNLLKRWEREGRKDFIVWSGFWMPIIDRYRNQMVPHPLHVDVCRIDAEFSMTFKIYGEIHQNDHEIWLWNLAQNKLIYEIPVSDIASPIPPFSF